MATLILDYNESFIGYLEDICYDEGVKCRVEWIEETQPSLSFFSCNKKVIEILHKDISKLQFIKHLYDKRVELITSMEKLLREREIKEPTPNIIHRGRSIMYHMTNDLHWGKDI